MDEQVGEGAAGSLEALERRPDRHFFDLARVQEGGEAGVVDVVGFGARGVSGGG